jgi:hypothetical protein
VVLYRWHPWHGRSVFIVTSLNKAEQAVFRCALEPGDFVATLEVPQWMFDPAICYRISMASNPNVSVEALRELVRLFVTITRAEPSTVIEAEHLPMLDPGGACAVSKSAAIEGSAGVVPPEDEASTVERLLGRGSRPDGAIAGAAVATTSTTSTRTTSRPGGAR